MAESATPTLKQFTAQLQQHRATPAPILSQSPSDPNVPRMSATTELTYKGKDYIAFSTGQPKIETEYRVAYDQFNRTGKSPQGFTILEAKYDENNNLTGSAGRRVLFNKISQATQQGVTGVSKILGQLLGGPRPGYTGQGILPGATERSLVTSPENLAQTQVSSQAGQAVAENVINPAIATPEAAGATIGLTAAGLATSGTSGLLPALIRAGGALTGAFAGQQLTGSREDQQIGQKITGPLSAAMISLGTEGLTGLVRIGLKSTLTQRAQKLFVEDITDLLQSKYPAIANQGPTGLNAVLSTSKGLSDITQAGVKALRGSTRESTEELFNELVTTVIAGKSALPRAFKTSTRDTLKSHFDEMIEISDKSLDNIGDAKILAESNKALAEIETKVRNLVAGEFKGSADINSAIAVNKAMAKLNETHSNLKDGALLIKAMKDAGADTGLTVEKFQRHIRGTFRANPESLLAEAGKRIGRGTNIAETGTDVTRRFRPSVPIVSPVLNKFLKVQFKPRELYRRPVGTISGERGIAATRAGATSVTNQSIRDFLSGE